MVPVQPALLTLSDKPAVISAAQDDQTASAEPPDNFIVHSGLNDSLDNTEEEPTSRLKPDSSVPPLPPAPFTLTTETPSNIGLYEAEEQPIIHIVLCLSHQVHSHSGSLLLVCV